MAEWINIFELGEWDVYVGYVGITSVPDPDSVQYLVPIADLDPAVGTVSVDASGLIQCDLENPSSGGGLQPMIVVVPRDASLSGQVRLTCSNFDDFVNNTTGSAFSQLGSLTDNGNGTYEATTDEGNAVSYEFPEEWGDATLLPSDMAAASGLVFTRTGASI